VLVFDGGGLFFSTTIEGDWLSNISYITTIKNEQCVLVFNGGWLFLITTTPPTTTYVPHYPRK